MYALGNLAMAYGHSELHRADDNAVINSIADLICCGWLRVCEEPLEEPVCVDKQLRKTA